MFDITIHQIVTESSCSDFRDIVGCQSMTMQSRHITMLRVRARNWERDGREVRQPKLRVTGSNQKRYYFFFKRLAGWFLCSPRSILEWLVTYTYVENVGIIIWWRSIQGCARKISASGFCSCNSCHIRTAAVTFSVLHGEEGSGKAWRSPSRAARHITKSLSSFLEVEVVEGKRVGSWHGSYRIPYLNVDWRQCGHLHNPTLSLWVQASELRDHLSLPG